MNTALIHYTTREGAGGTGTPNQKLACFILSQN